MRAPIRTRRLHRRLRLLALFVLITALTAFTGWLSLPSPNVTVPARIIAGHPDSLRSRHGARSASTRGGEWRTDGGEGGDHYSPLDEISRANVDSLRVAWIYRTGDVSDGVREGSGPSTAFESTPLLVNGTLYLATPSARVGAYLPEERSDAVVAAVLAMSDSARIGALPAQLHARLP